ncbi:Crp/Fnr family transcriptional regulator [Aliidiomarina sp. Khilg15.8]
MAQIGQNQLLAKLPHTLRASIMMHGRIMSLHAGQELDPPEKLADYTYFPESALLALALVLSDSATTEVMTVGQEGMLTTLGHSDCQANLHASVLLSGTAVRFPQKELHKLAALHPELHLLLDAYSNCTMCQLCQVIACYRHHSVRQQLSRWLLDMDDRFPHQPIVVTHAELAARLGVRREAISTAACILRRDDALDYHRGYIENIDRSRLLNHCCECYQVLKKLKKGPANEAGP